MLSSPLYTFDFTLECIHAQLVPSALLDASLFNLRSLFATGGSKGLLRVFDFDECQFSIGRRCILLLLLLLSLCYLPS